LVLHNENKLIPHNENKLVLQNELVPQNENKLIPHNENKLVLQNELVLHNENIDQYNLVKTIEHLKKISIENLREYELRNLMFHLKKILIENSQEYDILKEEHTKKNIDISINEYNNTKRNYYLLQKTCDIKEEKYNTLKKNHITIKNKYNEIKNLYDALQINCNSADKKYNILKKNLDVTLESVPQGVTLESVPQGVTLELIPQKVIEERYDTLKNKYDALSKNSSKNNYDTLKDNHNNTKNMNLINDKLYPHQINHVDKIKNIISTNLRALDVSETGTGKTYTSIAVCKLMKLKPLIICPKSVIDHWISVMEYFELNFYGVSNFESFIHEWYHDSNNNRVKCPYLIKTNTGYIWKHIPKDFILIVDEAHKCKRNNTYKWKILKSAADIKYMKILLLSATIADKPEYFAITGYTLNLYNNIQETKKWLNSIKNNDNYMKQIHHIIFPNYAAKMRMEDIAQMLPKHEVEVKWFDMDKHSAIINEHYKIIKSEIINPKQKINQGHALAKITFSRQVIELEKLSTFVDMAIQFIKNGFAVAIFVNFTKTLEELSHALDTDCIVYGEQSNKTRQTNINNFNTDKSRIIILNIKVGGESISLHDKFGKYPRISLISPSFSAQDIIQTLGRCYRVGSKSPVKQIIVCCDCLIEKNLFNILETKIQNISFLNHGKIVNCLTDTISESSNSFSKTQYENLFDVLDSLPITDTLESNNQLAQSESNNQLAQLESINQLSQSESNNQLSQSESNNCFSKSYSQKAIDWLNFLMQIKKIHICHAENDGEYQILGTSYKADGFCKETNTIYEFYGCYWHGCPNCYPTGIHINKYHQLITRENKIRSLGYILIFIWECQWNNIISSCENYRNHHDIIEV
jgi:superfamily II DNA or RNA helicase